MKKSPHRAVLLADLLIPLVELESTFAQLQDTSAFQSVTMRQKAQYRHAMESLRDLIHDLEEDVAQEELAS